MKEVSINHFFKNISQSKAEKVKMPPLVKVKKQPIFTPEKPPQLISLSSSIVNSEYIVDSKSSSPPLIRHIQSNSYPDSQRENDTHHLPIIHQQQAKEKQSPFIKINEENVHEQKRKTRNAANSLLSQIENSYGIEEMWMKKQRAGEILSEIFTKKQKRQFFLKYLQQTIIQNRNNEKISKSMDLLSCLIVKLTACYSKSESTSPEFIISQNQVKVDLDPPIKNPEKQKQIKKLQNDLERNDIIISQIRNEYDKIVHNLAQSVLNMKMKSKEQNEEQYDTFDEKQKYESKVTFRFQRKQTFGLVPYESSRGSKDFDE